MKQTLGRLIFAAVLVTAVVLAGQVGLALRPMGVPLSTTLVISKPAPGEIFGNKQVVTLGIGTKSYKFVLNDAYVDDRIFHWPDVWEYVSQHQPNFVVQGPNSDQIEHLEPGQMVTVKGMFAPLDRTFEIMFVEPGKGPFEEKKAY